MPFASLEQGEPPATGGHVIPFASYYDGPDAVGEFDDQLDSALGLEKVALGAAMMDSEAVGVLLTLAEADFFRSGHQLIRRSIGRLHARGVEVDIATVYGDLCSAHELEKAGGAAYVSSLTDGVPRASNIRAYVQELTALADTRRMRTVLDKAVVDLARDPDRALDNLTRALATAASRRASAEPLRLLTDVELLDVPDVDWLVEGRLPSASIAVGYGEPGIGKTFVYLDLAMSVATGREWLGAMVVQGNTVYVAAEGRAGLRSRVETWKLANRAALDEATGFHVHAGAINLLAPQDVERFIALARPIAPTLIIFDTLSRCMVGGDENSAQDMGLAIAGADRIRTALGTSVLLVHHSTKSGSGERGSSALRGAADAMFALTQTDDLLRLTCEKQKDAEAFEPLNLRLAAPYPGAASVTVHEASTVGRPAALTEAQTKMLYALREVFGVSGALSGEWQKAVPDIKERTFHRSRNVLLDRGLIATVGAHPYQRFFAVDTP